VRFIQLYDRDWDHHDGITGGITNKINDVDRASAALIHDLKALGMLDETLVLWGGEFGRTTYAQTRSKDFGRDHHPRCFSMWMAGGGVKPGLIHGATDEFGYNITRDPVHVHDLQATILHLLGIDHEALTYRFAGRDFRLTDVHGKVVRELLA
jgi:arylsulfatase A-like enzyme